jgi:hypothetical protein
VIDPAIGGYCDRSQVAASSSSCRPPSTPSRLCPLRPLLRLHRASTDFSPDHRTPATCGGALVAPPPRPLLSPSTTNPSKGPTQILTQHRVPPSPSTLIHHTHHRPYDPSSTSVFDAPPPSPHFGTQIPDKEESVYEGVARSTSDSTGCFLECFR